MTKVTLSAGALGCVVVTVLIGYWLETGRFLIQTDNAYVRADVVAIAPQVAGRIVAVAVADNQRVRAGDILARIDARDYGMKVEQAKGAVAAAKADVAAWLARMANLDAQFTQQRSVMAQAAAGVAGCEAEAHLADLEFQRQTELLRQEVTSAHNLQTAEAAARKTRAQVAQARAALATARDQLPVLVTERDMAAANLAKARGALREAQAAQDAAQLDLERTTIRAPVEGQVGQRTVRVGAYVGIGTPLLAIVPANAYVVANYKETQTNRIRPGQPVKIVVDALDDAVLTGHVESFAPASGAQFALLPPDNATGNFTKIVQRMPVRIRIDQGQARAVDLRPGASVETTIDTRGSAP